MKTLRLPSALPLLLLTVLPACRSAQMGLMKRGLGNATADYFGEQVTRLDRIADRVYSFRHGFDRDLIVETSQGLVIVDPFDAEMTAKLAAVLQERWPHTPVSHLIYTHYHLDHVSGGAALAAREVIAHKRCPAYWADLDASRVVPPTRLVEGDVDLEIGGVSIRLLDLGRSHTDTLFAVYLPAEKVLFGADLVFIKALPPAGHPDIYRPGLLRAFDRLAALDFQSYVPSHFDAGTKADFLAGVALYKETKGLAQQAIARHGRRLLEDPALFRGTLDSVFETLDARYGRWHGGGPMLLLFIQRNFVGEFLGF
jgi:glyoxylase-like metal-dependent hydrolase (beta-lactamase superfamily II)